MTKKGTRTEVTLVRKKKAWGLRLNGYTQREIASELKISQQAVFSLLKNVRTDYRNEFMDEVDDVLQEQVAIVWNCFKEAINSWYLSKARGPGIDSQYNQYGDIKYLNAAVSYLAEIRKIIGADSPIKFELDFDVTKLSEEELRFVASCASPSALAAADFARIKKS